MKQKIENILAVIFLILLIVFLIMALTVRCDSDMDPVQQIKQKIKMEMLIQ